MLPFELFVLEDWGTYAFVQTERCCLDAGFVPKSFVDKALQQFCSSFYKEALYASIVEVFKYLIDVSVSVDDSWGAAVLQVEGWRENVVAVDCKTKRIRS